MVVFDFVKKQIAQQVNKKEQILEEGKFKFGYNIQMNKF